MDSFLIGILILLLGRFLALSEGGRLTGKAFSLTVVFYLVATFLVFQHFEFATLFFLLLFLQSGILFLVERQKRRSMPAGRTLTLIIAVAAIYAAYVNFPNFDLRFHALRNISSEWLALFVGILLCLKESNFVIRWFFRHTKLVEKVGAEANAPATDNGRIIGSLERLLLFFFLWEGAALAATFIVAVKGLARFKKMEEHQAFAEYVIIGTFLSVLLTLIIYKLIAGFSVALP